MAATAFMPQAQPFRPSVASQSPFPMTIGSKHPFARDVAKPLGTALPSTPQAVSTVRIRRLPMNTSEESLRLMMVFSKELLDVQVLPAEQSEDAGFRCAILTFRTPSGAQEAKNMLDGKSNISNDAEMAVEILGSSPISGRGYLLDTAAAPLPPPSAPSSTSSSASSSRQANRFNAAFHSLDPISPPGARTYGSSDLAGSESTQAFQSIFSPQSPIGTRISGKSLIKNDAADDDETGELLKDPLAYVEGASLSVQPRRATAPQIPITRMSNLSLNTNGAGGPSSVPPYGPAAMGSFSAHAPSTMSPNYMSPGPGLGYSQQQQFRGNLTFPPVNPADQNPPCNTLYVGNLPLDTSEEELKALFSKQRGYKRLCFRTKQNGPMCFVEFEDISFATKALNELYGQPLHNSVKGGIRLSFSKNPLGVRSGQSASHSGMGPMTGISSHMSGAANNFPTTNGPPPGLSAPPGLGSGRPSYAGSPNLSNGGNHGWNSAAFSSTASSNNGWGSYANGASHPPASSSGYPPHMMGR